MTTGKVLLQSDGSPWRPLVHILDISHAFERVLVAPREVVHNQAFNVGRTGENYRIRDVANLVAEVVPELQVTLRRRVPRPTPATTGSTSPRSSASCRATSRSGPAHGHRAAVRGLSRTVG